MTKGIVEESLGGHSLKTRNYLKELAHPAYTVNDDNTNQLEKLISKLTVNDNKFEDINLLDIEKKLQNIHLDQQSNKKSYEDSDEENDDSDDYKNENAPEFNKKNNLLELDDACKLSADDNASYPAVVAKETDNKNNNLETVDESILLSSDNESNSSVTVDESNSSASDNEIESSSSKGEKIKYESLFQSKTDYYETKKDLKEKEEIVDCEEEKYLKRGIISRNKSEYRFSPFDQSVASSGHSFNRSPAKILHSSNSQDNTSSNVFDVIDFNEVPNPEYSSNFQTWALQQKSFECNGKYNDFPNAYGNSSSSYFNNSGTNLSTYQNINCQEVLKDDWSKMSPMFSLDNSYDSSNYHLYQPPTPPKSVSPILKESPEEKLFSSMDDYNVKKSEDLINIINAINRANKTEPSGIPEAELEKLRSVLECNDDSTRNEMDVYLDKDESLLQNDIMSSFNLHSTTNILEDVADDNIYYYADPLTPPNSEPPPQDGYGECNSPCLDIVQDEVGQLCSEKNLTDIINGIDEIKPDEMDIYLDNEKQSIYDTSYAKIWLQNKCKPNARDHAFRRLSQTSSKVICKKDKDGDTGLMIVYSQLESSPEFYENIFCMQEIVCEIKLCCDVPLGKAKRCKTCGNTDPSKFFTPLSLKNNQGYSALCCAVKTNLSSFIIDYLLDGILQNEEDVRRVFDATGKSIFSEFCHKYPSLRKYI